MNVFQKREIMEAIEKVQNDFGSDIFGFGHNFHIQNPKQWERIKTHWDDRYFSNAEINIKVETSILLEGESRERFGTRVK